jgi:hypothetical protein
VNNMGTKRSLSARIRKKQDRPGLWGYWNAFIPPHDAKSVF